MEHIEVGAMREFFAKVLDQVNDLSAQAGLVSGLQQQVNELNERVHLLEQNNYNLQQALNDANGRSSQLEESLHNEQANSQRATEHVYALRHTIVEADARVSALSTELTNERDGHRITQANLEDCRKAVVEFEQRVADLRAVQETTEQSEASWKGQAKHWEQRCSELQGKLDRVTSILNPA
jgi:chromosome segregation ATPase